MHSFLYNFMMYSITSYENKELITIENSNIRMKLYTCIEL